MTPSESQSANPAERCRVGMLSTAYEGAGPTEKRCAKAKNPVPPGVTQVPSTFGVRVVAGCAAAGVLWLSL
ncbi:hypothetical protein D3C78_1915740 [compost metagenome]